MNQLAIDFPPKQYQLDAMYWQLENLFVKKQAGTGLFLDPGLGKTRITLMLIETLMELDEIRRCLVVAPLHPIASVWPNEIDKWGFNLSYRVLHPTPAREMAYGAQVELLNYESLHKIKDVVSRWDMIVLDESTFIKTWSTKRCKNIRKLIQSIPRRVILTGTPTANSLADLHAQIYVLDSGESLGRSVTAFRNIYMTKGGYMGRQWIMRKEMKDALLGKIQHLVLRMQAEDHLSMPQLVENEIYCDMDKPLRSQYRKLKEELYLQLESGDVFANTSASAYSKCRQFANGTIYNTDEDGVKTSHDVHSLKLNKLADLHEELSGKPILVFYPFSHDRERIMAHPRFKKAPVICGGMNRKDVYAILDQWNKGKHSAILCQWRAASHGLNMQEACNDVVCYGVIDSPETYEQAFRRVYRQGVKGPQVRIHKLLMRGTVDEVMLDRLKHKGQTQAEFLQALKKHAKGA